METTLSESPKPDRCDNEYEDLVRSHQDKLRRYLLIICPNQLAREDILQETNRVLLQKRDKFTIGTNFGAWARRIAQLQLMSYLKQRKSKSWLSFDSELVQLLAGTVEEHDDPADRIKEMLSACLLELSEADRVLIKLKYEQELSLREINKLTGRSEGGIKQALFRIRKSLGDCIQRKMIAGA